MNLADRPIAPEPYDLLPALPPMSVRSDDLTPGAPMDARYSAAGGNVSPHLAWDAVDGAQSYVVSCFDPDAPTPAGFWHWTVVDLPAGTTSLPQGAGAGDSTTLPGGAFQVRNDGGALGYTGAAPPPGDRAHRYVFAVHALGVERLGVGEDATPTAVAFTSLFQAVARGTLTATFQA